MALNIKSEEAHQLAAELARLTGQTMTAVVIEALQTQIEQVKRRQNKDQRLQELMAIGRRCASHIQKPVSAVNHGDILFDEAGLPR